MDIEADFLVNPFSYILGAVSFIGFFILARRQVRLWLPGRIQQRNAVGSAISGGQTAVAQADRRAGKLSQTLLGLVLMGIAISAAIYTANAGVEKVEQRLFYSDGLFMLIMFTFTMLPGALAGIAAEAWINATSPNQHDLLNGLLTGILVYLAFLVLVEFTQMHILLFLCGPVITLAVFRLAPQ